MTRTEHLLVKIAEEACEVAQRATKALRFGLEEVQPGQDLNNSQRLVGEYEDLVAAFSLLIRENDSVDSIPGMREGVLDAKRARIEQYLEYSRQCGTLEG